MTKERWNGWRSIRWRNWISGKGQDLFRLLRENRPFFSLKLSYDENGILLDAVLDGEPIATKEGRKTPEAESGTMN